MGGSYSPDSPRIGAGLRRNALLLELLGLAVVGGTAGLLVGAFDPSVGPQGAVICALFLPLLAKMMSAAWHMSSFEGLYKLMAIVATAGLLPLLVLIDDLVLKYVVEPLYVGDKPLRLTFLEAKPRPSDGDVPHMPDALKPAQFSPPRANDARLNDLLAQLGAEDWNARKAAAIELGKLGDARAAAPLVDRLTDVNPDVRWGAAAALTSLGPQLKHTEHAPAAAAPLLPMLSDRHWQLRGAAAEALGALGVMQAVDPILRLLDDQEEHVVTSAATALGQLGDVRAIPPLINCLRRGHWAVRAFAATGLQTLTGQSFGEDANAWERWASHAGPSPAASAGESISAGLWSLSKAEQLDRARKLIAAGGEDAVWGHVVLAMSSALEAKSSRAAVQAAGSDAARPIAEALRQTVKEIRYEAVSLCMSCELFDRVRYELERWMVKNPDTPAAWAGLGSLYFAKSKFAPALACYERARMLGETSEDETINQLGLSGYAPHLRSMPILRIGMNAAMSERGRLDMLRDF